MLLCISGVKIQENMLKLNFLVFIQVLTLLWGFKSIQAIESDLTIDIGAGKRECFHQHIAKDSSFEVEYQVGPLKHCL